MFFVHWLGMSEGQEILIASSNARLRKQIRRFLPAGEFEVRLAEDELSCLRTAITRPIRLLIVDLHLRGEQVLQTLATLRKMKPHLSIVVVGDNFTDAEGRRLSEIGVQYRMLTPLNAAEMRELIQALAGREGR